MPVFNSRYFIAAVLLLLTEIIIGVFVHDKFIRSWGGDFLVVILLYCLVKSFLNSRVLITAVSVLLFSYMVETLQYFHIIRLLGLERCTLARVIIGTSFAWTDILAYTMGISVVLLVERWLPGAYRKPVGENKRDAAV